MPEFRERLHQLRKENNIRQEAVAKYLGYRYTTISGYESGRNQPSIENLKKLADFFHVSIDYLVGYCPYNLTEDRQIIDLIDKFQLLKEDERQEILNFVEYMLFKAKEVKKGGS